MRSTNWMRSLVRENRLLPSDFIWPLFIREGIAVREPIPALPGVFRFSIDQAMEEAQRAYELGIPAIMLFPYVDPTLRTPSGAEALNPDNLVCRAVAQIKGSVPHLGLIADIALDPYTSHGHDGLLVQHQTQSGPIYTIDNDRTVDILAEQACVYARAGVDVVAPSDMMDGRVGAIRTTLDSAGYTHTSIMAYTVKYASAFYGPFREAIGTHARLIGDKKTYQMDPSNGDEAVREALLDQAEGADLLIVKPGLPYLDVLSRIKEATRLPTFGYQVSGEYAMIQCAASQGLLDGEAAMLESLIAFKRAKADGIITYFAAQAAACLQK
jgi:porphobilinogen synthase